MRLLAAALLISEKRKAIACNGGNLRGSGARDVHIAIANSLRKRNWKVSSRNFPRSLLKCGQELKEIEGSAGVGDDSPTGLGQADDRPMALSPAVVVDIIQYFMQCGGGVSAHPNVQHFKVELKKQHRAQCDAARGWAKGYTGMNEHLLRKYTKYMLAFFRPGPVLIERSKMRQIQSTSMVNAITEYIMAEVVQRILPGQYVAKELLFNYDPTTLVYNLLKRGKYGSVNIALRPVRTDLPAKKPVAAQGGLHREARQSFPTR